MTSGKPQGNTQKPPPDKPPTGNTGTRGEPDIVKKGK